MTLRKTYFQFSSDCCKRCIKKIKLTYQDLKKASSRFCQQCEKHMLVPKFLSSVGRSIASGVHFIVTLAKMRLVAGTSSASAEEREHAVLQSSLCMVEGTVWPFWTLFLVLLKSCWLWGKRDPAHDSTWISEALWGPFGHWHQFVFVHFFLKFGICVSSV